MLTLATLYYKKSKFYNKKHLMLILLYFLFITVSMLKLSLIIDYKYV